MDRELTISCPRSFYAQPIWSTAFFLEPKGANFGLYGAPSGQIPDRMSEIDTRHRDRYVDIKHAWFAWNFQWAPWGPFWALWAPTGSDLLKNVGSGE